MKQNKSREEGKAKGKTIDYGLKAPSDLKDWENNN
jgi:hypothetical protein